MVRITMAIEREIEDAQSIRDAGASGKRKEGQSSSSLGKKPKFLVREGFKAATIRAKVRLGLLVRQDRRFVISAINVDI